MISVVNQKQLCSTVWNYILMNGHDKPLLVWCQWGTYCKENVKDVVDTHKHSGDRVRILVSEDEKADIPAFIQASLEHRHKGEKLIVISFLPWGREEADAIMERYEADFESVRYEAVAEEWVKMNFRWSEFNRPLLGFLRKHPEFFMLPYGEKPLPNSVGPCPESWADVDAMWSEQYYHKAHEWPGMRRSAKIRILLLCVATCIGNYEPLITKLKWYLRRTKGYDDIQLPPGPEFYDECNHEVEQKGESDEKPREPGSNFRDVFDENGRPVWES